MKKIEFSFIAFCLVLIFLSCENEKPWQSLFNGQNLDNWDKYIGTSLKGFDSLAQMATVENVFSVTDENGTPLIKIAGTVNASLATKESFGNYHLKLVFKWGEKVLATRNSGLLYHGTGDFGVAFGTWMTCIECQLMHDNLGDTYLMGNTVCSAAALKNDSTGKYLFSPGATLLEFGESFNGRSIQKHTDAENTPGEWNTVELYSLGETTVHVVNGVTVMVNQKTGLNENGMIKPLTSGKIQLQSEGGELFVKSIEVQPIRKLPKEIIP
jgi:hypothetical protein